MFYVAHRLFAAHDRALGVLAAERLAAKVGANNVFLPFCDTDEEGLAADVKGRRLFELDTQRLRALSGILAILHGPSLDDGVCMEIGYAAVLGTHRRGNHRFPHLRSDWASTPPMSPWNSGS